MKRGTINNIFKSNRKVLANFSYLSILEIFIIAAPLFTYPYLVKTLGRELYGWVITAQVTASYCTVLIDFGFKRISARHIAINNHNKDKINEVVSAILTLRSGLWILSFLIYSSVILLVPSYREHYVLFFFSFLTTISSVLFLDFYFQGTENMKYITIVNIVVRGTFVIATFFIIKKSTDYIYVPLLWSTGYALGGALSLWIGFHKYNIKYTLPDKKILIAHLHEGSVIFTSDVMITIKDKFNYNLMGALVGVSEIVIYDIGAKICSLLQKPVTILSTVLFPRIAKRQSVNQVKKAMGGILVFSTTMVILVNAFLPQIVKFFILEDIDLDAIRLYTLSPIFVGISWFISMNVFFAFGKQRLVLKSTYVTTIGYLILLGIFYFTGYLNSVMSFVILTVSSYLIEAIFRGILCNKIFKSLS
ncbi:MAG: oligosaccharide flippase family protein [Bacteroides sp.]|nr:oligosaccharide flippase family protein [Bacteroides sp.]